MAQQVEKESNRLITKQGWNDAQTVLTVEYFDGGHETFDRRRATVTMRENAELYGFGVKISRFHAVSIEEFPEKKLRAEEGRRRFREWREHVYAGNDSWDLPKTGRAPSGPNEADLAEILDRKVAGKGQAMLAALIKKHGGELPKAREDVLARTEFAVIWAQIQNERRLERAKAAPSVGTADDLVASLGLE